MSDAKSPDTRTALQARYGGAVPEEAAELNETVSLLYRHRSVRSFTPEQIDEQTLATIIAAAQSAATSSNLQSWSVIEIRDQERKDAAARLSGDQSFISRSSVFLVFIADWARNRLIAESRDAPVDGIGYLETTLVGFVDAALAAQNATIAAESLGLGAVYIGSVRSEPEALSQLLGLPLGSFPVVGIALGYPDPDDPAGVKPRLPQDIVRHREVYRDARVEEIAAYDSRLATYYATQGLNRLWSSSVLNRVRDAESLHGRHLLRGALERRGLSSR